MEVLDILNTLNRIRFLSSRQLRKERVLRNKSNPLELYNDDEFRYRYRLSKDGFAYILYRIHDRLKSLDGRGSLLTPEQKLAATLRFFATGSYQRVTGDLTGIHVSIMYKTIQTVTIALTSLKTTEIVFPS